MNSNRRVLIVLAIIAALFFVVSAVSADSIATVFNVERTAYGTPLSGARNVKFIRDSVVLRETLETVSDGALDVKFVDDTTLLLGGGAQFVVDEMIYDPNAKQGSAFVKLLAGTFFYTSGLLPKENVVIETPTATIGIRGTEFSVTIGPAGETSVSVISGKVDFTSRRSGQAILIPADSNASVSPEGTLSPIVAGIQKTGDIHIDRMAAVAIGKIYGQQKEAEKRAATQENNSARADDAPGQIRAVIQEHKTADTEVFGQLRAAAGKDLGREGPQSREANPKAQTVRLLPVKLEVIATKNDPAAAQGNSDSRRRVVYTLNNETKISTRSSQTIPANAAENRGLARAAEKNGLEDSGLTSGSEAVPENDASSMAATGRPAEPATSTLSAVSPSLGEEAARPRSESLAPSIGNGPAAGDFGAPPSSGSLSGLGEGASTPQPQSPAPSVSSAPVAPAPSMGGTPATPALSVNSVPVAPATSISSGPVAPAPSMGGAPATPAPSVKTAPTTPAPSVKSTPAAPSPPKVTQPAAPQTLASSKGGPTNKKGK